MIAECDITSIQKNNYENLQKVLPNYYELVNKIAVDMSHACQLVGTTLLLTPPGAVEA